MTNPWTRLPRRIKQSIAIPLIMIAALFGLDLATVIGMSLHHSTVSQKVDAVVVLGAKVGTPALKYRTLTGLKFYEDGKTDTIVLSGARGPNEPISEAKAMEDVIRERITKTHGQMPRIILETQSTDTYENLTNSKKLIPNAKSIVVVSDGYHLARSVAMAKHIGFKTVFWNSPKPDYYENIDLAHYYVREAVALIVYIPKET